MNSDTNPSAQTPPGISRQLNNDWISFVPRTTNRSSLHAYESQPAVAPARIITPSAKR